MAFASFVKLSDAVSFLVDHLDRKDFTTIAAQCANLVYDEGIVTAGAAHPQEARIAAIQELARRHARLSLRWRYLLRRFPSGAQEFELGGHNKELGHVHVNFVRAGASWQIKEIWICR